jgi:small nuclear ribonucleoprotein (snRNP)-like protein
MHGDTINDFLSKEVEVKVTTGNSFIGTIKLFDEARQVVILSPQTSRYKPVKKYGDTAIRQKDIISIREILPQIEEDFDDERKYKKIDDGDSGDSDDPAYSNNVDSSEITDYTKVLKSALKSI